MAQELELATDGASSTTERDSEGDTKAMKDELVPKDVPPEMPPMMPSVPTEVPTEVPAKAATHAPTDGTTALPNVPTSHAKSPVMPTEGATHAPKYVPTRVEPPSGAAANIVVVGTLLVPRKDIFHKLADG